jgi:phosphate:Na+ symporter
MKFGLLEILTLIGAVGLFLYGMKLMSEGLQKAAGDKLRNILALMTNNRFIGAFTGRGLNRIGIHRHASP